MRRLISTFCAVHLLRALLVARTDCQARLLCSRKCNSRFLVQIIVPKYGRTMMIICLFRRFLLQQCTGPMSWYQLMCPAETRDGDEIKSELWLASLLGRPWVSLHLFLFFCINFMYANAPWRRLVSMHTMFITSTLFFVFFSIFSRYGGQTNVQGYHSTEAEQTRGEDKRGCRASQ